MSLPPLKYARVERERRWLLDAAAAVPECDDVLAIVDRYVTGSRLRLRETLARDGTRTRKLGHKVRLGEGPEEIACTSLYLDEAEWELLAGLPAAELRKERRRLHVDGRVVAVDVFAPPNTNAQMPITRPRIASDTLVWMSVLVVAK